MGLTVGTKVGTCMRLGSEANMTSSLDGTCPRDSLQGLVAGTSPLVCADLKGISLCKHVLCDDVLFCFRQA